MIKTHIKNYLYLLLLVFAACASYRFLAQTMYQSDILPSGGAFTHIQISSEPSKGEPFSQL
ncbi:hypothetical protein [Vibrio salinus]|uniref:hypothetical protein n=1 Tax=Vibrio salinus TaxID=2899784 RepID=UPI001E52533A|nr:hypothetical protein [Vibrio salinus]MCE0494997.1 hypothetical protein [Vibrio salinus]